MDITQPPEHNLGADLLWWRTAHGMRTTIAILWSRYYEFPEPVHIEARLFDAAGSLVTSWRIEIDSDAPLFIDSSAEGPWKKYPNTEGILALYVCTENAPKAETVKRYSHLSPFIDWHQADGRHASLHSDQFIVRSPDQLQKITEIVVIESETEINRLVLLNGEEQQAPGVLSLSFKNVRGEEQTLVFDEPMKPFSVQRISFSQLFPDIASFSEGHPILVSGSFFSHGLFTRPYLETTGKRWGIYHAGDVYRWQTKPYFVHALIGGEVNPMAVVHDSQVQTVVNLLHSHDGFEDDVSIDVKLYDETGALFFNQTAWCRLARHGLHRFNISELLESPDTPFRGHIALSFTVEPGRSVPTHLQALLEYRHASSIAHVMAWSDEWNSKLQLAKRDKSSNTSIKKAYNRVHLNNTISTELAITNAGHENYVRDAQASIFLYGQNAKSGPAEITLAPYATCFISLNELFPDAESILDAHGFGLVVIESESELATVAFTRLLSTGSIAAEHFLPIQSKHEGKYVYPSGN